MAVMSSRIEWRIGSRRWRGKPLVEGGEGDVFVKGVDDGASGKKLANPTGRSDGLMDLPYDLGVKTG